MEDLDASPSYYLTFLSLIVSFTIFQYSILTGVTVELNESFCQDLVIALLVLFLYSQRKRGDTSITNTSFYEINSQKNNSNLLGYLINIL